MKKVEHQKRCPDCWHPLSKETTNGPLQCINPECPVIYVTHAKGKPHGKVTKIIRAAVAR